MDRYFFYFSAMKQKLRIVFMGTPEFATASLDALLQNNYEIVGVITAPDKPAGRGKLLSESHVRTYARQHGLNIMQPANLKDPSFISELQSLDANLGIVVAFRMLPQVVWSMPALGTFNLHASLLPQYRGAAPINHAIINGETETGVTTFFLKHEIDTGSIIFREPVPVLPDETFGELHDRLKVIGASVVVKTVRAIERQDYSLSNQEEFIKPGEILKPAPKIFRSDCRIDWNLEGHRIINLIRGLSPYPAAFSILINEQGEEFQVKVFKATFEEANHSRYPGEIDTNIYDRLSVFVNKGLIHLTDLQVSGRKRMGIKEFLNGFRLIGSWRMQ